MESMHELVALADDEAREDVEFLPRAKIEEVILVRCPSCQGLRGVSRNHHSDICRDCKKGKVIPRWTFCSFWVERFSMEEIDEMARAIWS